MKILVMILFLSLNSFANQFKGYDRRPSAEPYVMTESIVRMEENKLDFLIAFSGHAVFYRFAKKPEYESQVRDYLQTKMKQKEKLKITVDIFTTQILFLEDLK